MLSNVEDKFAHDLIGTGENLLDNFIVLSTEWENAFKDVLATMIACLKIIIVTIRINEAI